MVINVTSKPYSIRYQSLFSRPRDGCVCSPVPRGGIGRWNGYQHDYSAFYIPDNLLIARQIVGNNTISLKGTLQPHTDPANLAAVSMLFTNFLNGISSPVIAQGLSTFQADGSSISWLSQGLQDLKLDVLFQSFTPINPIQSISITDLALQFDQQLPFDPQVERNSVQASLRKYSVYI